MMQYSPDFVKALREVSQDDLATTSQLYDDTYSQARTYRFPGYRRRHRHLLALCGVHPLHAVPRLPDWWPDVLALAPEVIGTMLRQLSAADVQLGQLPPELFEPLKALGKARSPRLSKLLASFLPDGSKHPLYRQFEQRGSKLKGEEHLVVSAHPWDILTMGASQHFSTCQHIRGEGEAYSYNKKLPANLLDSGMVVAYIDDGSEDRWAIERMRTRTILRLLWNTDLQRWGVLIDRFYGDVAHMQAMRVTLASLLQAHDLLLWSPRYYYQYHQGTYIPVARPEDRIFSVRGIQQRFGPYTLPYLDQAQTSSGFGWHAVDATYQRHYLVANVLTLPLERVISPNSSEER